MQTNKKENRTFSGNQIHNTHLADSGSKIIFDDNILCSQFLRDYIDLPYLKDVKPEDIEDVSEQFVPLFAEERNADRVKRVNIKNENPFFLVSLIEHKTKVDYNVSMQIFCYMVYIWESYEKEAEKMHRGISKRADFKYPPILPIVYYEGSGEWTVPLRDYSNEELIEKKDEISLVMLINKMQTKEDIEAFRRLPAKQMEEILQKTPSHLLDIISNVLKAFLLKENVPVAETEELVSKVKEKKMAQLFENMEKMDIQAERRKTQEAKEEGIRLFIEGFQEISATKEITVQKLAKKFGLSEESAQEKMRCYWKE